MIDCLWHQVNIRTLLDQWIKLSWLRPIDIAFANFLWTEAPNAHPLLILAAALVSHQLGRGHACLDLAATLTDPNRVLSLPPGDIVTIAANEPLVLPQTLLMGLSLEQWLGALEYPILVGSGTGNTPLVLVSSRLYLRRYWQYEQQIRVSIERRLATTNFQKQLPIIEAHQILDNLFPPGEMSPNWQKIACALAARNTFSIITGGPGTGKTTTVVSLLFLLQALAFSQHNVALRIRLAAPTGKAAARLNELCVATVAHPRFSQLVQAEILRASIPTKVTTLHRLLGGNPQTRHFRYHAGNQLAIDVLVIDEASMIDLEMMAAVFAALPDSARIILIGDKDQLASVEAGSILGELCPRADHGHYTIVTADWLHEVCGEQLAWALIDQQGTALDQAVVMLRHSYRFSAGIGHFAKIVNEGNTAALSDIWEQHYPNLTLVTLINTHEQSFEELVVNGTSTDNHTLNPTRYGYRHYLETLHRGRPHHDAHRSDFDIWALAVLQAYSQFQILCALRQGPWGVDGLNQRIANILHQADLIAGSEGWYLGRPVLVTRNDYSLGLMNGDIGITLALPADQGHDWIQRVAFPAGDASKNIKWILPTRLPAVETVYALTVHKSQGSEFAHVALVLPDNLNPMLTRELLYTGITRARDFLTLVNPGGKLLLEQIVQRRVLRASGLWVYGE